jgi:hypothetical protein
MSLELIFYTQLASIFAFVGTVFVLYRLLVQQKDATIEAQRERISFLQDRVASEAPDVLYERQGKRIKLLQEELQRLAVDANANADLIKRKTEELVAAEAQFAPLQKFALNASGLSMSYFCPACQKPTLKESESTTTYFPEKHSRLRVAYTCGREELNGEVVSPCQNDA